MHKVLIAGCGYIGARIARLWRERGAQVTCIVRTPEKARALSDEGFDTLLASFDNPGDLTLPDTSGSLVYYLVPPPGGGIADTRARNFRSALSGRGTPLKVIYVSATSVYSESGGGVVTEQSPTLPFSAMGKRRLDAEGVFREYAAAAGVALVVLRVSGIYGPGRLPLMQIRQGQPLLREAEAGPSNRIHADDLARICLAAADRGQDGDIFNISDGHPSSMTTYFNACADALGEPRQPQVTLEEARRLMSPLMFSYVSESRVVDNSRMLKQLGVTLQYAQLEQGLAASCRQQP